jgi:hypothetical protein
MIELDDLRNSSAGAVETAATLLQIVRLSTLKGGRLGDRNAGNVSVPPKSLTDASPVERAFRVRTSQAFAR